MKTTANVFKHCPQQSAWAAFKRQHHPTKFFQLGTCVHAYHGWSVRDAVSFSTEIIYAQDRRLFICKNEDGCVTASQEEV